ncbi:MAG: hypothetical protein ABEJ65_12925 [bacterium]
MKDSPQNLIDIFKNILQTIEDHSIPYMIVGSVASIVYGEPRLTNDMDLVIEVPSHKPDIFQEMFPEDEFYCPPIEVLRTEISDRGQFNVIHHNSGLKVDFVLRKQGEHGTEEFSRRQRIPLWEDLEAFVASPEDVIIKKLDWYRETGQSKHVSDIRGILSATDIDEKYLQNWIEKLGLNETWGEI